MSKHRWFFYTDLFGSQRWEQSDEAGVTVMESTTSFLTLAEAVDDASQSGYSPQEHGAEACALALRLEAIAPVPRTETSDA